MSNKIDFERLPNDVVEKLTELDLELAEGDITQKGYDKKRLKVLAPFLSTPDRGDHSVTSQAITNAPSPSSECRDISGEAGSRCSRKSGRTESRYHSEVRQEAVQQALNEMQSRARQPPAPSKRNFRGCHHVPGTSTAGVTGSADVPVARQVCGQSSAMHASQSNFPHQYDTDLDNLEEDTRYAAENVTFDVRLDSRLQSSLNEQSCNFNNQSAINNNRPTQSHVSDERGLRHNHREQRLCSLYNQPPDVIGRVSHLPQHHGCVGQPPPPAQCVQSQSFISSNPRVGPLYSQSSASGTASTNVITALDEAHGATGKWKVSAKIQQLLTTLKRPKRRPLPEYYIDDEDEELQMAAQVKDANAPRAEGAQMNPIIAEPIEIPSGLPRSLEAAIQRYGSASFKATCISVLLDAHSCKLSASFSYGKLLNQAYRVALALITRVNMSNCSSSSNTTGNTTSSGAGSAGRNTSIADTQCGDCVALIYPNTQPVQFMVAFYGCLFAGFVPLAIEVPLTARDAGCQQIGLLLAQCKISLALTTESCYKSLPSCSQSTSSFTSTVSDSGRVICKGWPKLSWMFTDSLPKLCKDWQPPPRLNDSSPAYIEYTLDTEGSAMGVCVSRTGMLSHVRSLTMACGYTEGEVCVCVVDYKRDAGLWHGVMCSVFNGMHVIFVPYSLMKSNPACWMHLITKYKATISIVKSRDLHWGMLANKDNDYKDINLSSLRFLLVVDGANPWSLSSCDLFISEFKLKGLRADAVCPCACSTEALTVAMRRPGNAANGVGVVSGIGGRGVLSMNDLSHGVVRVDKDNSLTSLILQDCGTILPDSVCVLVRDSANTKPHLCSTDEIGEICLKSASCGISYWALPGISASTFSLEPESSDQNVIVPSGKYCRSGLLGFIGPGGLVFVCGSRSGLISACGRRHNSDDVIATVLAVDPMRFIYRGRVVVFGVTVLYDSRLCIVAEKRPEYSEDQSYHWMSRVIQAVDSIHQIGVYCLCLVPYNSLPKTPLGGIHLPETRQRLLNGSLHPVNVLMSPHSCIHNLPKPLPSQIKNEVGPASIMVGNIVQGNRLAHAKGRDMASIDDDNLNKNEQFISEMLRWRAQMTSDHVLFTLLNARGMSNITLTCSQLHKKAERIASLLCDRGHVNTGDYVALIYPPGVELIASFYACMYVGVVPVCIRPPHPQTLQTTLLTVRLTVLASKCALILSTQAIVRLIKCREASSIVDAKSWPCFIDTDDPPRVKRSFAVYRAPTSEITAYVDYSVSTTGVLSGIRMSHGALTSLCRSIKLTCELYPSRHILLSLDPYSGLGLVLWCICGVYAGHHTILLAPSEMCEASAMLFLTSISQYTVRDVFCSYGVVETVTRMLTPQNHIAQLASKGVSLACVRLCAIIAEERPRLALCLTFQHLLAALGLSPRAVSSSFGCRACVCVCLQGCTSPQPLTVYVDQRALRRGRIAVLERGAPHSLCLVECGALLPGTRVVVADPDTRGQCGDSALGEIWVQAGHTSSAIASTQQSSVSEPSSSFEARLVTGACGDTYVRSGYLGFLRRTDKLNADGSKHDAVFIVGALAELIHLRGMIYHPIDIETSVIRSHRNILECAVFVWSNLLVIVAEFNGHEDHALDPVAVITNVVLEHHHQLVGVVVIVDPNVIPINSRGEKQRMHLRDSFLQDQLDPVYVAYNT